MDPISKEVAEADINRWLDELETDDDTRKANQTFTDVLVKAVCKGYLTVTEKNELVQKIKYPAEGADSPVTELKYKNRLNVNAVYKYTKAMDATDADGRVHAHVAALTGYPLGVVRGLEMRHDFKIAQAIVVFFLS